MSTGGGRAELMKQEAQLYGKGVSLFCRSVTPADAWAELGVLHGYGDHSGCFEHFLEWMAERGVACRAIDFRGHGRSSGRRGYLEDWKLFLEDVAVFLGAGIWSGSRARFLLGHSHGGLVLAAAGIAGLDSVAGCILTAPYLRGRMYVPRVKELAGRLADRIAPWLPFPSGVRDEWLSADEAMVRDSREDPLRNRIATPRWYLGALAAQEEALRRAPEFTPPLLVAIGDADPVSDPRTAREFYLRASAADKTFRLLPGQLHEILREREREKLFAHILDWLRERA